MTTNDDPHQPTQDFREYVARDIARAMRHNARFAPSVSARRGRRFGLIAASAIGTVVALGIGLAFGTSTGYASARVEAGHTIDEMTANANYVTQQIAAIRLGIARTRTDISLLAEKSGAASQPSLQKAESELGILESVAARIEQDFHPNRGGVGAEFTTTSNISMKRALALACTALAVSAPAAKPASPAEQVVPVVDLAPATVSTRTTFGGVLGVRQLSDGSVYINDGKKRQIHLFDSTLATSKLVIDSTDGTPRSYGPWGASLIPFGADSSLFAQFTTQTLLVIDARGNIVRTLAPPSMGSPMNSFIGTDNARFDPRGRLIYKDDPGTMVTRGRDADGNPRERVVEPPDSAAILRADLDARSVDTVGRIMLPGTGAKMSTVPGPGGKGTVMKQTINPLITIDDFAVLSDGTVAFVRGHDYHVDWVLPDGTKRSTAKLPFDWKRLTDADKQRLIDSARAEEGVRKAQADARWAAALSGQIPGTDVGNGRGARGGAGAPSGRPRAEILTDYVTIGEVADYYPPIRRSAAKGDADGNLWVLPSTSAQSKSGELVYDVVNPKQGLVRRVRVPLGRSVVGFGKGGIVYLMAGDMKSGFTVERTRLTVH